MAKNKGLALFANRSLDEGWSEQRESNGLVLSEQSESNGFTLIELIVVISIIILISGLTLAYYNNFTEQQKLDGETNKIVSIIELAKRMAFVSDLQNIDCQGFSGYTVSFAASSYSMKLVCTPVCVETRCSRTFALSSSNFTLTSDSPTLTFKPMYSGIEPATGINITLTDSLLNKCKKINVSSNGIVSKTSTCP